MDTTPTLISDLKPQTHHNSMLVDNHNLLFMLKRSIPSPHAFPFLRFFTSTLLSTSYKNGSADILNRKTVENFIGKTLLGGGHVS